MFVLNAPVRANRCTGLEDGQVERILDGFRGVSAKKSAIWPSEAGAAEGASASLGGPQCHNVTLDLIEAIRSLDAGRVDLARAALERAMAAIEAGQSDGPG
jgi:hypothetical protein